MKYIFLIVSVSIAIAVGGCKKDPADQAEDNCAQILKVKISADKDSFNLGDEIRLKPSVRPDALYVWTHNSQDVFDTDLYIASAEKADEGWYYLSVSHPDCASINDSIFISVRSKAVAAPCSPANNTVSFASIPSISAAHVSWAFDPSWNRKALTATGPVGYPDLNIYFNAYWNTKEPEDGEYSITTMSATGDYPPYTVYISSKYENILFEADPGKIYVSHVNGKLRVTFCNLPFTGSYGQTYHTTASAMLTAP